MNKQSVANHKKPAVIFDIDYTIFNTTTFRSQLFELLAEKLDYPKKKSFVFFASKIEQETKEQAGYFDPILFVTLLKKRTESNIPLQELIDTFFDESLYIESLYTEAQGVFQELVTKQDIPVLIFSTGAKKFQLQKIAALKSLLTTDNIHIFVDKLKRLKDFLKQYDSYQLYLVDDLPTVLKEAKVFNSTLTTIWINRDASVTEKDFVADFCADYVIENLEEIVTIVTKKN